MWHRISTVNLTQRRFVIAVLAVLGIAISLTYLPIFQMGFVSDDFTFVKLMHFTAKSALVQDNFGVWLADFVKWSLNDLTDGVATLRPIRMVSMWGDYLAYGAEPLGYHITSLLLHWGTSFVVFLIALELSRKKSIAFLAGVLFAILPIHTSDVAWVAARYHVIGGLFFALGFYFYLKAGERRFYFLAIAAFVLALFANEATIAFPLAIAWYEIVYRQSSTKLFSWDTAKRLLPFWLIPIGYVGLRFLLLGQFGGPPYARYDRFDLEYKLSGYVMYTVAPLLTDITWEQTLWLLTGLVCLLLLYRSRRLVVFGILWIPIVLAVFISLPAEERYYYIPSIGLVLALAAILADPVPFWSSLSRWAGIGLATILLIVYGVSLYQGNENWRNASRITERIIAQVKQEHPKLANNSHLVFVNLPKRLRRAFVFFTGIGDAMKLSYDNLTLSVIDTDHFPILTNDLDRTYFFEYDDQKLTERPELVEQLRNRKTCASNQNMGWEFDQETQGWEPWNDLDAFQVKDGQLEMQATGSDPSLGSPVLEIETKSLRSIQVTMSVRSQATAPTGALYWQTLDMDDFSPAALQTFPVIPDGATHTYDVTLALDANSNKPLVRLRLDPIDSTGEIRIDSIRVTCK